MFGISKNKSDESEKLRISINEIETQLVKCKQIDAVDVDVDKYDSIIESMKKGLEKDRFGESSDGRVDFSKTAEILLAKEQILEQATKNIKNFETEYKEFIEQQKENLKDPEAELSRIKVKVKRKREEMDNLVVAQEAEQISELINDTEEILRNVQMQREAGNPMDSFIELPVEEITRTRAMVEEDEKKLYAVRKSIHASKEILSFMEFRFQEIEQVMAKGGYKDLKAEWMELKEKKQECEKFVNDKQSLMRKYVERLFEVRQELQEIEHPVKREEEKDAPEDELQKTINSIKDKINNFQNEVNQLIHLKDIWNQEFTALEMTLEDLWRKL